MFTSASYDNSNDIKKREMNFSYLACPFFSTKSENSEKEKIQPYRYTINRCDIEKILGIKFMQYYNAIDPFKRKQFPFLKIKTNFHFDNYFGRLQFLKLQKKFECNSFHSNALKQHKRNMKNEHFCLSERKAPLKKNFSIRL